MIQIGPPRYFENADISAGRYAVGAAIEVPRSGWLAAVLDLAGLDTGEAEGRLFELEADGVPVQPEAAAVNTGGAEACRLVRCIPVFAGEALAAYLTGVAGEIDVDGTLSLYLVDPMNALNVAMPAERTAGSVLDWLHRIKARLWNRVVVTAAAEDTVAVYDDDDITPLGTQTLTGCRPRTVMGGDAGPSERTRAI